MMNINLDFIEAQLRTLFEDRLTTLFTGSQSSNDLINELIRAMRANLLPAADGTITAPDLYILQVSPDDLLEWQSHQGLLGELTVKLHELGLQNGFTFLASPEIELQADPKLPNHAVEVTATFNSQKPDLPDTAAMDQPSLLPEKELIPANAFLVVAGKTNFPLEKVVVNIGRHSDNDLMIEDDYTSRHHAQLRAINRRYVIFDVGSTGGLYLNGKIVTQATLQPGDVIRIGMVNLIYIQDTTSDIPTTAIPVDPETGEEPV